MTPDQIKSSINTNIRQKVLKDSIPQTVVADMMDMIVNYSVKNLFSSTDSTTEMSNDSFVGREVLRVEGAGNVLLLNTHFEKTGGSVDEKLQSNTIEIKDGETQFIPDVEYLITLS